MLLAVSCRGEVGKGEAEADGFDEVTARCDCARLSLFEVAGRVTESEEIKSCNPGKEGGEDDEKDMLESSIVFMRIVSCEWGRARGESVSSRAANPFWGL